MKKTSQLQQLLNATETLIESNKSLIKINATAFNMIKENQQKEKKLLAHCGKIYNYLQSKITKTWEEEESMQLLYQLITHAKNNETENYYRYI